MPFDVALLIIRLLAAAALYGFLGILLVLLWRDSRTSSSRIEEEPLPGGQLVVIECGDVLLKPGQSYPLRRLNILGRGPASTIVLPDTFASIEHAHVVLRAGCWWLEDRHSLNGTTVNAMPVQEAIVLSTGDVIGIGSVRLRVDLDPAQPKG
jgi:hypothetical protein